MKNKLILVMILIMAILSLQSIQAADLNDTFNDEASFSEFQEIMDNSTFEINLTKDYTYHEGDKPVLINKSVVINGNNHTFNALNKSSIFNIKSNDVVVKNINFLNANSGEFQLNTYSNNGYTALIFDDSEKFTQYNDYLTTIPDINFGGAIYLETGNLVLKDCEFENNHGSLGGAIYTNSGSLFIDTVTFFNNHAYCGAAIYMNVSNSSIFNSKFINNTASSFGAGIYQNNGNVRLQNLTFINNHAKNNATLFLCDNWEFQKLNLTYYNSFINFNNIINPICGAENLYNNTYELMIKFPYYITLFKHSNIINKSFCLKINDEIYNLTVNKDRYTTLRFNTTLSNCNLFFFNPLTYSNYTTSISLFNSSFYNLQKLIDSNSQINLTKDYEFCQGNVEIEITKPIVINGNGHIIDGKGKSRIFNIKADNVVINNLTLINANFTARPPNDVFYTDFSIITLNGNIGLDLTIYDSGRFYDVNNNEFLDSNLGGAIYCRGNNLKIFNLKFINNQASTGGAIYISGNNSQLINLTFINNTANVGGAICNFGQSYVLNPYFDENIVKYWGDNVYSAGNINIQNPTFKNTIKNSIALKGTWQIDNITSKYYNSFIKFGYINFTYNLTKINGSYYNLKIIFGIRMPWGPNDEIGFDYKGFSTNKKFSLEVNGKHYNLTTNSKGEANLKLNMNKLYYIKVSNPITQMQITKASIPFIFTDIDEIHQTNSPTINEKSTYTLESCKIYAHKNTIIKKPKNIKITIKNPLKNKILKVKLKGMKYKIKVNKKGVGYFKITKNIFKNLKKGKKYKYRIEYSKYCLIRYITVK